MLFSLLTLATSLVAPISGAAVVRRAVDDTTVLNFALTLEHLENNFYSTGLKNFSASDFKNSGFDDIVRTRFEQVASHEATHVAALQKALGSKAVKPCTYTFPVTGPKSFARISEILEGTGTGAYLGAASLLSSKSILTTAGSILAIEARHTAWASDAANKQNPFPDAFELPLDGRSVVSLASQFIVSCPSSNGPLPFKAFPKLTIAPVKPDNLFHVGHDVQLTFDDQGKKNLFLVLKSGDKTVATSIPSSKKVKLPDVEGTNYAYVATDKTASANSTIAGVGVVQTKVKADGN